MSASTSKALIVLALLGLSAATVGGWSMYYMEKKDHEANTAQLTAQVRNHQRHIESLVSKSDDLKAKGVELETTLTALKQERVEVEGENLSSDLPSAASEQERLATEGMQPSQSLQSAMSEQEALTAERVSLQSNLEAVQSEQDRLSTELSVMLAARDQLQSNLQATRQERDRMKADLDQKIQAKEMELSELESRVEGMNAELAEASGKIGSLESEVQTLGQERDEIRTRFAELKRELESDLQSRDIEIEQLKGDLTVIRLGSDILFDTGSAQLKEAGRNALGRIAAVLNKYPDRQISLEGHTDAVPISERLQDEYATNWELSTARAARAVRYLQQQGVRPERLRAVGYGPYRPVADNDDPGLRGLNRRLEIMLLPVKQTVLEQSLSNN